MRKPTVLVVEDEPRYHQLIRFNLQSSGYRVVDAFDGHAALQLLDAEQPDLVILDIMLPGMDGYAVCLRIREQSTVPIIMLTAKAEQEHKVRGLMVGADDYVTKPFSAEELLARVGAVLRRQEWDRGPEVAGPLVVGEISLDASSHQVLVRGEEVALTPTEFRLLQTLMSNRDRVVLPDDLLRKAWGSGYEGDSQLLRTAIKRLRHKVEPNPENPTYIVNRRGVGYCFTVPGARSVMQASHKPPARHAPVTTR